MRAILSILLAGTLAATQVHASEAKWYTGDEKCPPPKDDGTYSAPYDASEHPYDFPIFPDADKPGWSCSYQREDGVIVQFGDSRTPKEQWLSLFGGNDDM